MIERRLEKGSFDPIFIYLRLFDTYFYSSMEIDYNTGYYRNDFRALLESSEEIHKFISTTYKHSEHAQGYLNFN